MNTKKGFIVCLALQVACADFAAAEMTRDWVKTFRDKYIGSVSADGLGNAYFGAEDSVGKFDANGVLQWTWEGEGSYRVSADGIGHVYAAANIPVSLTKLDANGAHLWTQQFDPSFVSGNCNSVSADGLGNIYVAGWTGGDLVWPNLGEKDAYVAKYDASGVLQWFEQFGTNAYDYAGAVSADRLGNIYVAGSTEGDLGGPNLGEKDAYVAKYDANGAQQWIEQFGTGQLDLAGGISADSFGNVFVAGITEGSLWGPFGGPIWEGYLVNFDTNGQIQWGRQFDGHARRGGVSADRLGGAYVSTTANADYGPMLVSHYDGGGTLLSTGQPFNRPHYADISGDVSADHLGNVFVDGWLMYSINSGTSDGFVAKFVDLAALGDYNDNGLVGQHDLDLVLLNWGNTVPPDAVPDGWVNDQPQGQIGQTSLDKVLLNWGEGAVPPRGVSIPEPGCTSLLILGATSLWALFRTSGRGVRRFGTGGRRVR